MHALRTPGGMLFALAVAVLVFFLAAFLTKGPEFVEYGLIPNLLIFTRIALLAAILLLPLAFIRVTRAIARWGYLIVWLIFGVTAWVLGFLFTLQIWGVVGVIVGLALAGAGVILTGILALLFNGNWAFAIEMIVLSLLALGARRFTVRLAAQLEPQPPVGPIP